MCCRYEVEYWSTNLFFKGKNVNITKKIKKTNGYVPQAAVDSLLFISVFLLKVLL